MDHAQVIRRFRGPALKLLVIASILGTLVVATLWITTQFRTLCVDRMVITRGPHGSTNTHYLLTTAPPGMVVEHIGATLIYQRAVPEVGHIQPPQTRLSTMPPNHRGWKNRPRPNRVSVLGFGINIDRRSEPWTGPENIQTRIDSRSTVTLPWWLLFALTAWPGLVWTANRIRTHPARREARGLCRRCAYDLQGINSDLCPECATQRPR